MMIYSNTNGRKQDVHLVSHGMLVRAGAHAAIFDIIAIAIATAQNAVLSMRLRKKRRCLRWRSGWLLFVGS